MNPRIIQIANKNIYLTDNHHEVLLPWAMERRQHDTPLFVLTLDHHTDTLPAFTHMTEISGEKFFLKADYRNSEDILQALKYLRHDEHFDYALQCDIIHGASFFTHQNFSVDHDPRLQIIHEAPVDNDLSTLKAYYSQALESDFLLHNLKTANLCINQLPQPFILDIDLDYFKGEKSIQPQNADVFADMIRQASAVTISRETDWVRLLNMDFNRALNSDYFQNHLLSMIRHILPGG